MHTTDTVEIRNLPEIHLALFKHDMQDAFQSGYEQVFGPCPDLILPEKDIDDSLKTAGAHAYVAIINEEIVGGAVVVIDSVTQKNHLDFLYVKTTAQGRGVGYALWKEMESLYPKTEVWETCTPYFDKRNIHFYVNKCGFHITEFFNPNHPDPQQNEGQVGGMADEGSLFFFRFEKRMKPET